MAISVCIVDDNKDILSALEQIVVMADGYELCGSFSAAEEALREIPYLKPDVVLMDINLGEAKSGLTSISLIRGCSATS